MADIDPITHTEKVIAKTAGDSRYDSVEAISNNELQEYYRKTE